MTQAQAYGENLVLTRTYRADLGRSGFIMEDVVENRGFLPVEHMLLYHFNIGFPFVDDGAELIAPFAGRAEAAVRRGRSRRSGELVALHRAADGLGPADLRARPGGRCRRPRACRDRQSAARRAAPALRSATTSARMPRYIEWRMMAEGQYAVGIEPCTNGFGREAVKAAGELIVLQPGESRTYRTELGILDGASGNRELPRARRNGPHRA